MESFSKRHSAIRLYSRFFYSYQNKNMPGKQNLAEQFTGISFESIKILAQRYSHFHCFVSQFSRSYHMFKPRKKPSRGLLLIIFILKRGLQLYVWGKGVTHRSIGKGYLSLHVYNSKHISFNNRNIV